MFVAFSVRSSASRLLAAALAALFFSTATAEAQDQQARVQERVRAAFPVLRLKLARKEAGGLEAVNQLGPHLAAVAAWYGKSARHLQADLLSDRRLRIDRTGRLLVVDELEKPLSGANAPATARGAQDGELAPLGQTFMLHSKPGSRKTLYLDFDGAVLSGTGWNTGGNTIQAAPFDLDGNPGSFSAAELQRIQYIWQRVAEDYAPFDIDVTTEAPPLEKIRRASLADDEFGTIALITKRAGVYSCSCGGVAYVGVFGMTTDFYKPALVFYDALSGGNEKFVAEAISHEVGHNLGLTHDGAAGTGYYTGHGNDPATGWAPIMGVGYYKPLVQFSRGEYGGANNKQNDFAVVQSYGLPLRADDHGNGRDTATIFQAYASNGAASGSMNGVMEFSGDRDTFAVMAGKGAISASVAPSTRSPNADLVLSLYDGAGNLLARSNPAGALGASLSYQAPAAGTYYLEVAPTGNGDPATSGYSSYGSVGYYRLSASFATAGGSAPQAVLTASASAGKAPLLVTLDGSGSTDDKGIRFYYWDFGDGTGDNSGALRTAQKTYHGSGNYTVRLSVVDDTGLISTVSRTIAVNSGIMSAQASVNAINVSIRATRKSARATAVVRVVNQAGQALRNATVRVSWSGNASGAAAARTNKRGEVRLTSKPGNPSGCMGVTVTGIEAPGYSFDSSSPASAQSCR